MDKMITYKNIGMNGRIGNSLFAYSALFGIAKQKGVDFAIPYENSTTPTKLGYYDFFSQHWIHYRFDLNDVFNITAKNIPYTYNPDHLYYEKHFEFDSSIFDIKDNTDINGWFQSCKYFENYEDELRNEFTFKDEYLVNALTWWTNFGLSKGTKEKRKLLIAMRIGDGYEYDKNFATVNIEYYKKAISMLDMSKYDVIITADDIEKCVEILEDVIDENIYVLGESCPYTTLAFYSLCDDFIIPNSTFAWWGAWFGTDKNKKVILPEKWFNADGVDFSTMSPENWIKI